MGLKLTADVLSEVITTKNMKTIQWLLENGCNIGLNTVNPAFETGNMELALLFWNICTKL